MNDCRDTASAAVHIPSVDSSVPAGGSSGNGVRAGKQMTIQKVSELAG